MDVMSPFQPKRTETGCTAPVPSHHWHYRNTSTLQMPIGLGHPLSPEDTCPPPYHLSSLHVTHFSLHHPHTAPWPGCSRAQPCPGDCPASNSTMSPSIYCCEQESRDQVSGVTAIQPFSFVPPAADVLVILVNSSQEKWG